METVWALRGRATVSQEGGLVIHQVQQEDAGTYVCEMANGDGQPNMVSAVLDVTCQYIQHFRTWFHY